MHSQIGLVVGRIYESALNGGAEAHAALLDATSAYDSVSWQSIDVCLAAIGAPEELIHWLRLMMHGTTRRPKGTVFSDKTDKVTPKIGYLPGPMPSYVASELVALGMELMQGETGNTVIDRELVTGDSPEASQQLGKIAVPIIIEHAKINGVEKNIYSRFKSGDEASLNIESQFNSHMRLTP